MAHTTCFVDANSSPSDIKLHFLENDYTFGVMCNQGALLCMEPAEFQGNILALKGAGYHLYSVKGVKNERVVVATYLHNGVGSRGDPLATAFERVSPDGYSIALKKECMVCRNRTNVCCASCRVAHWCSTQCRIRDYPNHKQWCEHPKYDLEAFKQGIDKVRGTVYKHKVFNSICERWITPRSDGSCGYAEWSWKKMKEELEGEGVQF